MEKEYEIGIRWTAFPLHPDTPEEGRTLEELFAGRAINLREMMDRLKKVAHEEGLPWGDRKKTYNSRLAQELGKWAESKGKGDQFHNTVFRAYFVHGENIGKIPVLVDLAKSLGLSPEDADRILKTRAFKEAVDSDWAHAGEMGITAVPTFAIGRRVVVGAQPYGVLQELMRLSNVMKREHRT